MAAPNFNSLLSKPADSFKRPPLLPEGTYYGTINNHRLDESSKKKTPFVEFAGVYTHAHDDVELKDPETGAPIDVQGRKFTTQFYLSEDATFIFTEFAAALGIETEGRSLGEIIPQVIGQSVQIQIAHEPYEDRSSGEAKMAARVRRVSAVSAS